MNGRMQSPNCRQDEILSGGRHQEFSFVGAVANGVWGTSPSEARGKAPGGRLGDKFPQKLMQFADFVYRF